MGWTCGAAASSWGCDRLLGADGVALASVATGNVAAAPLLGAPCCTSRAAAAAPGSVSGDSEALPVVPLGARALLPPASRALPPCPLALPLHGSSPLLPLISSSLSLLPLQFLVALQAALTVVGNCTCWAAAYRIYQWSEQQEGGAA